MTDVKGIVGEKLGMTQLFVETRAVPVTVIKAGPCVVAQIRTREIDGYDAVQLAYGQLPERHVNQPTKGHFEKAGAEPARHLVELRTDDAGSYSPGQAVTADVFDAGDTVDVVGVSKGKGFSGVMKRHGFSGLRGSHGVKGKHRSPGAIGACATPVPRLQGDADGRPAREQPRHRPQPGGRAGRSRARPAPREGAVPGPNGGLVMVRTAVKAPTRKGA